MKKKLLLSKERLKTLSSEQLVRVAGGMDPGGSSIGPNCDPMLSPMSDGCNVDML